MISYFFISHAIERKKALPVIGNAFKNEMVLIVDLSLRINYPAIVKYKPHNPTTITKATPKLFKELLLLFMAVSLL